MESSIVLRRKQVAAMLGVSLATLWRWGQQAENGFPKTVALGPQGARCVGYLKADVEAWVASRAEAC